MHNLNPSFYSKKKKKPSFIYILACNSYKHMDAFKIKHTFYYKNINDQSNDSNY